MFLDPLHGFPVLPNTLAQRTLARMQNLSKRFLVFAPRGHIIIDIYVSFFFEQFFC